MTAHPEWLSLSEQPAKSDRYQFLPPGWSWADWSGGRETQEFWASRTGTFKGNLWATAMGTTNGLKYGRPVGSSVFYMIRESGGIGHLRVNGVLPYRAYAFQEGPLDFCITHFVMRRDDDVNANAAIARKAREEHRAKHPRTAPTKQQ